MTSCIVAGYTVSKVITLNITVEEAILRSKKKSSFLVHMLGMMDPQQIKSNEITKDAYEECLQLKDYLSEQLWSVTEDESIFGVQSALDELIHASSKYEMTKDMVEGEWEIVDASAYISAC